MMDMMKMLGNVKAIQAKLKDAQDQLGDITAEGEAGGGMVKAVANGKKQLLKVQIDKDIAKPEDVEMLEDLVVAAVNRALESAEEKSKAYIQQQTEGLLNIPGMDLGSLMNG
ncbi:MAG: YbaB/EbfC family nucleoid-associated protein [Cytophagales bacterium]|nr:MAG: YbaB/EbfC family nucleoid-associated protein [Cytophagales bacterium]